MRVYVDAGTLPEVAARFGEMAARGVSMAPVMAQVGTILIGSVHETFAQQGRPEKWKQRSTLTDLIYEGEAEAQATKTKRYQKAKRNNTKLGIRMKAAQNRLSNKILMDSGALRNSIVLGRVTDDSVEIGSSLIYARIHQLGGTIVPKHAKVLMAGGYFPLKKAVIPARPYLGIHEEDVTVISRLLVSYITGERTL